MAKRHAGWVVIALLVVAALAILIPGSPTYLPTFFETKDQYQGYSARHWIKALNSANEKDRHGAIFALGAIGSDAGEAVPELAQIMLEDPDHEARHQASLALSKMCPASRAAVPELAQALKSEDLIVRMNAVVTLFQLREGARPAIPALIEALKDEANQTNLDTFHLTIQSMAAITLGRASSGSEEGVPALRALLASKGNAESHWAAARALGQVGAPARLAVPELQALLGDNIDDVREAAQEAIQLIQGERKSGNPPLAATKN
jgi:HEAT repeat protein